MAERDETFLSRWSRLKRTEAEQTADRAEKREAPEQPAPQTSTPACEPVDEPADPNADLPPIDSLDKDSDYSAFMRSEVAPELRKRALARLWRSDPVFANLDGLVEYGEDYALPFRKPLLVATAYQVGRGMVESVLRDPALPQTGDPAQIEAARSRGPDPDATADDLSGANREAADPPAAAGPVSEKND